MKRLKNHILPRQLMYMWLTFFFAITLLMCRPQAEKDVLPFKEVKLVGLTNENEVAEDTITLDTVRYNEILQYLVHSDPSEKWPVNSPMPLPGSIVPFNRIIAFYGNLYSKGMGVLGALPEKTMLDKLAKTVDEWNAADSMLHAIPALHYIAVTAQAEPGAGNKYRLRMPFSQIDKVIRMADTIDALVFLDIQPGHSNVEAEIPQLRKYLQMPNVHLGIDPEYAMHGESIPCQKIGTLDAKDINYAATYLADLVKEYNLPPKILIIHRFTKDMMTNYAKVETRPEVQIIINMDGFGSPAHKKDTYQSCIVNQPVQFAGFKLFYRQDRPAMMKPEDVLKLNPKPVYIQYQ